ncbi:hypothetical protein HY212_02165 [Candidatus Pacearchaeota archaeon]|nr:hypothetical protein [Candidatus Pacearchaeota archaeon]
MAFSFSKGYAFLAQPPFVSGVFPGGVAPNLAISPTHDPKWKNMCLRRSEIFHDETLILNGKNSVEKNRYDLIKKKSPQAPSEKE